MIKVGIFRSIFNNKDHIRTDDEFKVGVLCPVEQPGSYWDRSTALPFVLVEPTQR